MAEGERRAQFLSNREFLSPGNCHSPGFPRSQSARAPGFSGSGSEKTLLQSTSDEESPAGSVARLLTDADEPRPSSGKWSALGVLHFHYIKKMYSI